MNGLADRVPPDTEAQRQLRLDQTLSRHEPPHFEIKRDRLQAVS